MTSTPAPSIVASMLPAWAQSGELDLLWLRVSTRSAKELRDNAGAGADVLRHLPAAQYLNSLNLETLLLDEGPVGQQLRDSVGAIRLLRAHAHRHALSPGALMGWLIPSPQTSSLIVLVSDSASEPTVQSPDEHLPSNAVVELLVQLLVLPAVRRLHFTEWARWVREPTAGPRLRHAAQLGHVEVFEGAVRQDIYSTMGQQWSSMKDGQSSGERTGTATRTTRGTLSKLDRPIMAWPYARALLMPAYELGTPTREIDDAGKKRRVSTIVASDEAQLAGWQGWAEAICNGESYERAGQHLATHEVWCRGMRHLTADGTPLTYDKLSADQLTTASGHLARAHFQTLHTLTYVVRKSVPIPIAPGEKFEGHEIDRTEGGDHGYGVIRKELRLPPHGLVLSDEQWQVWRDRVESRQLRDRRVDELRAPFANLHLQYVDESGQRRAAIDDDWIWNYRITGNGASYELWRRDRDLAHDDHGALRGWNSREGQHLLTWRKDHFERAYSKAGQEAVLPHLDGLTPVVLPQRPSAEPQQSAERLAEQRGKLDEDIVDATDRVEDALTLLEKARLRGRGIEAAEQELEAARSALMVVTDNKHRLTPAAPDQPVVPQHNPVQRVAVDTPARLFGVLEGAAGSPMPRCVSDQIAKLSRARLDVRPHPTLPDVLQVTDVLDWPTDTGSALPLRLDFLVPNRRRDIDEAQRAAALREAAARLVLRDGRSVDDAATILGLTRRQLVTHVRAWLKDPLRKRPVTTRGARSAIVDCPEPQTKLIVYEAVSGRTEPLGREIVPRFRTLVQTAYFGRRRHNNAWVARQLAFERRVLGLMQALEGQGVDLTGGIPASELAQRVGCTSQEILRLCDGAKLTYRGVLERVTGPRSRVRPRRCLNGHAMFHVLPTLETASSHGVLCQTCRQMPDGTPLPPSYFLLYDGPDAGHDLATSPGTVLRDAAPLPAPGPRPVERLSIGEAARYLGVTTSTLREWGNNGLVACTGRPRRYEKAALDSPDVQARVRAHRDRVGTAATPDQHDGHLTLTQAAARLGVEHHYLVDYVTSGRLVPDGLGGRNRMTQLFTADAVDAVPPQWCDRHAVGLFRISAAAEFAGAPAATLRTAAATGLLRSYLTDGGTVRFAAEDLETWQAAQLTAGA